MIIHPLHADRSPSRQSRRAPASLCGSRTSVSTICNLILTEGTCISDNTTSTFCTTNIARDATGSLRTDPLRIMDFALSLTNSVTPSYLLVLSLALGTVACLSNAGLHIPAIFNWRHARNVHCFCITTAGGAALFSLITVLNVRFGITGALYGVTNVSVNIIGAQRGSLLEGILWASFILWVASFLGLWGLRWSEILVRRDLKRAVRKAQDDKRKKAEADKKAAELAARARAATRIV